MVYQTLSYGIMNPSLFGRNEGGSIYHEGVQNTMTPEALSIEIATQTNEYTRKHIEATLSNNWYPTNPEEIKALIVQYWYSNCHGCSTTPYPRHVLVPGFIHLFYEKIP